MLRIVRFSLFCVLALASALALAAPTMTDLRAYANQDKTRVVFDFDAKPTYATANISSGSVFVIRVKNLNKVSSAPASVELSAKTCLGKITRQLDHNDARYLFNLNNCGTPSVFVLNPQKGNPRYRLVADFPHSGTAANSVSANAANQKPTHNKSTTLYQEEQKLLEKYTTKGKDGIRSMSKEQAAAYQKELTALRDRYEQQTLSKLEQPAKTADSRTNKSKAGGAEADQADKAKEPVSKPPVAPQRPFVVAIDAGHGGKDPGAIGASGVREKNVTLKIATELANLIKTDKRFLGVMIRTRDAYIDLDKRSALARLNKANLLISIHADSVESGQQQASGPSVWVLSENRAERENTKILHDNSQETLIGGTGRAITHSDQANPYVAATLLDMSSANTRSEGYLLGQEILQQLAKVTKLNKSKPIHASLAVLKAPDIPSLLIETGFLSNNKEEKKLNQSKYQKQLAQQIFKGLCAYYEKYPMQHFKTRIESAEHAKAAGTTVVVQKGDSLSHLAVRYGTTVSALKKANNLKSDVLKIGQKITIPAH